MENGARSKRNYQGAKEKTKKEQGAKRDETGAVKIDKKDRTPKNGREQEEWGKMSNKAGSLDPPNRALSKEDVSIMKIFFHEKANTALRKRESKWLSLRVILKIDSLL